MPTRDAVAIDWLDDGELPTLTAVVDDVAMRLVVDTGANAHIVDETVAFWAHLPDITPTGSPSVSRDGTWTETEPFFRDAGATLTHYRVRGPAPLRIGVAALETPTPVATHDLSTWRAHGIAGLFSPQRAVPLGSALEVDLASRTISLIAPSDADAALAPREGWLALSPVCPTNDGVALFAVHAEIAGQPVLLVVDTGATGTFVDGRSDVARALAPPATEPGTRWALGGPSDVRVARDVEVRVGEAHVRIAVDVVEWTGTCDAGHTDGALGADVLRRCQLILVRDRGALRCPEGP